jgi:hypothetical protein
MCLHKEQPLLVESITLQTESRTLQTPLEDPPLAIFITVTLFIMTIQTLRSLDKVQDWLTMIIITPPPKQFHMIIITRLPNQLEEMYLNILVT